jgi:hypothetical protein
MAMYPFCPFALMICPRDYFFSSSCVVSVKSSGGSEIVSPPQWMVARGGYQRALKLKLEQ